ncbi:CidA/LrgA family holin-like protein [Oceanobacillus neutriphilus]|uniref:Holin-like protein CidA 2 n=1 Tax=Oceanobacillus neutriphilus TaxID=531815 RepID=A0ABQ2P026_9BACI|nr:CidA/LrgA family holin-like protein [Oceanobacillus neutriphilus]GGP14831.1 holin-like protein CidA 2 [Oceanobacillus neutriphilus]
MKYFIMILQISVLFLFNFIGQFIQGYFSLSIPGSLIGMLLLFSLLILKVLPLTWIQSGVDFLLKDIPFFFIPVTVGVVQYLSFFYGKGSLTILLVVISTFFVIGVSGTLTNFLLKKEVKSYE